MGLRKNNTRTFYRKLYAGWLVQCTLLKRGDDQRQKTVTAYTLFGCYRNAITKTGEPIQHSMSSIEGTRWHIPALELKRVGVNYINAGDRVVETHDTGNIPLSKDLWRYWGPFSDNTIEVKLFSNMVAFDVQSVDPPAKDEQ